MDPGEARGYAEVRLSIGVDDDQVLRSIAIEIADGFPPGSSPPNRGLVTIANQDRDVFHAFRVVDDRAIAQSHQPACP
jgi:hypothetical protein